MKKNIWLRILAAAVAIGLLAILLLMTLSFTGDPISAALADKAAQAFIQESDLRSMSFQLSHATYNFKFGEYTVQAKSDQNADLHFEIVCENGKVRYDTYEQSVLKNGNVIARITNEYSVLLQVQLEQAGLGRNGVHVQILEPEDSDIWVLGMPFDQNLAVKKTLQLYPDLEELTLEAAADYLQKVEALLSKKEHRFQSISLFQADEKNDETGTARTVMLSDIPVEEISKPGFLAYLRQIEEKTKERDQAEREAMEKGEYQKDTATSEPTVWIE